MICNAGQAKSPKFPFGQVSDQIPALCARCISCNAWVMTSKRQQQEAAGRWLREARERRGYRTAGALARRMGVSDSLISRYETGVSSVSDDRAEQIAVALNMNIITVRRGLGLWVPEDSTEDDLDDEIYETENLTPEEERLIERLRTDPEMRRRFFDAVLAGHGQPRRTTEHQDEENPGRSA